MSIELKIGDSVPECLLRRHVHQEQCGDRGHGLAVAVDRVQHGVRLEHAVQLGLADALVRAAKQLVGREVSVQVLLDGLYGGRCVLVVKAAASEDTNHR